MDEYVPPPDPGDGRYYPTNFRVLDCWQCFRAKGKICIDKDGKSLYPHTKDSVFGNALCCKPDNNDNYCNSGEPIKVGNSEITPLCSPPSYSTEENDSSVRSVLTGQRNYLYWAFCPAVQPPKCGMPNNNDSNQMQLRATINP